MTGTRRRAICCLWGEKRSCRKTNATVGERCPKKQDHLLAPVHDVGPDAGRLGLGVLVRTPPRSKLRHTVVVVVGCAGTSQVHSMLIAPRTSATASALRTKPASGSAMTMSCRRPRGPVASQRSSAAVGCRQIEPTDRRETSDTFGDTFEPDSAVRPASHRAAIALLKSRSERGSSAKVPQRSLVADETGISGRV